MNDLHWVLMLAAALFATGLALVLWSRHVILALMGIESMLMAAGINVIAFWVWDAGSPSEGMLLVLFAMAIAAAEAAVGLALAMNVYRHFKTVNLADLRQLKE